MRTTGQALVAKAIAELSYEELLRPTPYRSGYRVNLGAAVYEFRARRGSFDSWRVDVESVRRSDSFGTRLADDPLQFLVDARDTIGLDGPTLAEALRDLVATWSSDERIHSGLPTAAELVDAGYAELESWQSGHPSIVLNKGRLGFTGADVVAYAPASEPIFRLPWLAAHPELAASRGIDVLVEELDDPVRRQFTEILRARGVDPAVYVWFPVHPYHLNAAVRTLFAPYLADGRLIELGEAPDRYRPLSSVRTLVNVDSPERRQVKLTMLMRNTLVWRGLPAPATEAAPAISAWLHALRAGDKRLSESFDLLGEVASVAVRHPLYDSVADAPYRYHELLGAVWREPVESYLACGERARTLAALTQVGSDGRAVIAELVARSGLSISDWLAALAHALLPGLLHALHGYGVAFCPHGENTIVVFDEREVPVRIMLKDFAEDIKLLRGREYPDLDPAAYQLLHHWTEEQLAHSILSALFAGPLRYVSAVVSDHLGVTEPEFWRIIRAEIDAYRAQTPELAERHQAYGLTAPRFDRVCLNREQLSGGGFHDRVDKEDSFDLIIGTVPNPVADV